MNSEELISAIKELKRQRNAIILAHNYQKKEIHAVADVVGDSLELALRARDAEADILIVCGVRFMAETAKILNEKRRVFIPAPDAGCPLADFLTPDLIRNARKAYPDAAVVLYVNSAADAKAMADIVCTSGNAVNIVRSLSQKQILFGPDANLASHVAQQIQEKEIIPLPAEGHCYVHACFSLSDIKKAREIGGKIIVHPECPPEVQEKADYVVSTGKMPALTEGRDTWHIFTETGMIDRLIEINPDGQFLGKEDAICEDMKKISLEELYECLKNLSGEIFIDPTVMSGAKQALERMLAVA